jgi:hypothetical protein
MGKHNALDSRWPDVLNIALAPAVAHIAPTTRTERRNVAARTALVHRIHREFEEMPGLSLTLVQATRLFGINPDACSRILLHLTETRLLRVKTDGRYMLRTEQP